MDPAVQPEAGAAADLSRRSATRILLAVVVAGFALRLWGCFGQGLPYTFYDDERNNVERTLAFGARGTLDPGWFNKPALGYYIWFAEFGAYYLTGKLFGWFQDSESFAISYFNDPGPFILIARINATLFGTLGIWLAYLLGRRLRDRTTGILAAIAVAVTAGQAASCQEVKKDVVAALFTSWSALALLGVLEKGRWKDYVLSGFAAGLGTATKYYPAALAASYIFAHLFREPGAVSRSPRVLFSPRFLGGAGAYLLGFFAGSPYNFLSRRFLDDQVLPQLRFLRQRFLGWLGDASQETVDVAYPGIVSKSHSVWDQFQYFQEKFWSGTSVGPVLGACTLLGVAACLVGLRRRCRAPGAAAVPGLGTPRKDAFLLVTVAVFTMFLTVGNRQFSEPRHMNLLYPFTAVLAAIGVRSVAGLAGSWLRRERAMARAVIPAFVVLIALPLPVFPLRRIVESNRRHLRQDERLAALAWIEENVRAGSGVINDKELLPLRPTIARCNLVLRKLSGERRRFEDILALNRPLPPSSARSDAMKWAQNELDRTETYESLWGWEKRAVAVTSRPTYEVLPLVHDWYTERLNERTESSRWYNPTWEHSPWGHLFDEVFYEARSQGLRLDAASARKEFLRRFRAELELFVRKDMEREGLHEDEGNARFQARLAEAAGTFALTEDSVSLVELWRRRSPLSERWMNYWTDAAGTKRPFEFEYLVSAQINFDNYDEPRKFWKQENFPDWAAFYSDLKAHYDSVEIGTGGRPDRVIRIWDLRQRKECGRVLSVDGKPIDGKPADGK